MNKVILLVGATATGKTGAAIKLAKKIGGEIISADSRQVYRHLDIGTNKPPKSLLKNPPHHLIDIVEPDGEFNAGDFVRSADSAIREIISRGHIPIITGGTGLYARALTDGLMDAPADAALRDELLELGRRHGNDFLYEKLSAMDPETARSIDRNNPARVTRALQVCLSTGRKFSELKKETKKYRYEFIKFGLRLPREEIYRQVNERVDDMIERGLVTETKKLVEKYSPDNPVMNSTIGYREIIGYLGGKYDLDTAVELIKRNTRRYAKRQATWFKKEKDILWVDADKNPVSEILNYIRKSGIIENCGTK